jgi:hypothetical protein
MKKNGEEGEDNQWKDLFVKNNKVILFDCGFFHIFHIFSLFSSDFPNFPCHFTFQLTFFPYFPVICWKIQKKSMLNSEKIWTIWKKDKLNSEMIWKIRKKIVKR